VKYSPEEIEAMLASGDPEEVRRGHLARAFSVPIPDLVRPVVAPVVTDSASPGNPVKKKGCGCGGGDRDHLRAAEVERMRERQRERAKP
jgi:hypothetical protein